MNRAHSRAFTDQPSPVREYPRCPTSRTPRRINVRPRGLLPCSSGAVPSSLRSRRPACQWWSPMPPWTHRLREPVIHLSLRLSGLLSKRVTANAPTAFEGLAGRDGASAGIRWRGATRTRSHAVSACCGGMIMGNIQVRQRAVGSGAFLREAIRAANIVVVIHVGAAP
jgi:hypothetical protein